MANKFRQFLYRLLYGRYGADNLYNALFITELVLLVSGTICNVLGYVEPAFSVASIILYMLTLPVMIYMMFRFFSRNIQKRRRENEAWLRFLRKFKPKKKPRLPADTADHIFRRCPHCHSTLRLPRTPGKHEVKCPRCEGRFSVKVKK